MSVRGLVADAAEIEDLRVRAGCLGLTVDQVAYLEAEASRMDWLRLSAAMTRKVRALQLGGDPPAPPATMVEHAAVLRAHVRRLVWHAVFKPLVWLARWLDGPRRPA